MSSLNGHTRMATLRIQRFNPDIDEDPCFEDFEVELTKGKTILNALLEIKAHQDGSLAFRRSCRHGICGSCAMNVNGINMLACEAKLQDHLDQEFITTIRPLSFVPIIKDLITDCDSFWDQYLKVKPWLIPIEKRPERGFLISQEEVNRLNNAERCINCGVCYSACPVIRVDKGFVGPHGMLKAFLRVSDPQGSNTQDHLSDIASIWDCTTCLMCNLQCPKDLDPGTVSPKIRSLLVEDGRIPRTVGTALTSTFRKKNPFEQPHAERSAWAKDLALKNAMVDSVDTLLFSCCLACYDQRAQQISKSTVKVMRAAGIEIGTLDNEEACCGSEVRRLGELGLFEMMVEEQVKTLSMAKFKRIVTISPHCFDVFNNHYPSLNYPIMHYSQYIAHLVKERRIVFRRELEKKITYHDPCYLGIQNQIYNEPREILESIPGVELVEMERSREASLCCGGGGGRMWYEGSNPGAHLSHQRVRDAMETGAQIIATACPFCLNMLDNSVKALRLEDQIKVKDIVELVATVI